MAERPVVLMDVVENVERPMEFVSDYNNWYGVPMVVEVYSIASA